MFAYDLNILEQCVQPNRKRENGQPSFKDASISMSSSSSKFENFFNKILGLFSINCNFRFRVRRCTGGRQGGQVSSSSAPALLDMPC